MISPRTHPRPRSAPWFAPSGISPASEESPKAVTASAPTRAPPPIRKCPIFTCTSSVAVTSAQCSREGDQRRDASRIANALERYRRLRVFTPWESNVRGRTMAVYSQTAGGGTSTGKLSLPWIIAASSVGTLVEWYDFYIYGVLAVFFAQHFFPPGNPRLAFLD